MSGLLAGAARRSIGPRPEDLRAGVYLGGFGSYRQRRATGVLDEPQCRALVLSDGTHAMAIAALDLVGASGPLLASIRRDAARVTDLRPESILFACTHSHASPDLQGLWGGVPDAYRDYIGREAVAAIAEAHAGMRPAAARAGSGTLSGWVQNRRGWPDTDETLTALVLRANDGGAIATVTNYACHPTAIGPGDARVSRDWCGFATDAIEAATGGVALYVNGAIGDANPARAGGVGEARALGEAVATTASALARDAEDIGAALRVDMRALAVPMNIEGLSERVQGAIARAGFALSALSKAGGMRAASAALHAAGRADLAQIVAALAMVSEREIVRRDGQTYVATHCGRIGIGEGLGAVVAPGEVLTRLGLPLRASIRAAHAMFFGLTQDTLGYFVPEDEWMTGRNNNYEESVSPGRRAGETLRQALLGTAPGEGARP